MEKQNLVIISGPTAVGKTSLSIKLAKLINGSIISADSMQVYKHMDIGSAKITQEEMQGIKHYLIDVLEPEDEFNIATFKQYAKNDIDLINQDGKLPIIAGGTGFYIQSLLYDIDFNEVASEDTEYREELAELAKKYGASYIHNMLKEVDIKSAETIHPNNTKRVIRALEYYKLTGNKISDHNEEQKNKISPYNFKYFVINEDRNRLYKDIDGRVDIMIKNGLVDEVEYLKNRGLNIDHVSMQGLGYKEILMYLDGKITLDEAVYIIKRDTRHFAKRQLTWFRREKDVIWINKEDFLFDESKILEFMKEQLEGARII
ncbi:MAG: tRNA (adenosine(37)-N6)-dimethylallyltransferase MiaA [Lachnospiraceae bacterium]|nr:tRNA (adenosine(37)-N6)-dimethylallyltransferase MiaA [Lachnospiraceae bacterium]